MVLKCKAVLLEWGIENHTIYKVFMLYMMLSPQFPHIVLKYMPS